MMARRVSRRLVAALTVTVVVAFPHFSWTSSAQRRSDAGRRIGSLALHPENPHYLVWRGRPTVIIASGEHYGAVPNLDFDYRRYIETLARDGMNGTRTFAGTYVETGSNFNITGNTLDPAAGRFISPWARSAEPGYADGGNKFDLTKWDEAYFARLRDFLRRAGDRGVIVELTLFCPLYEDSMWSVSPMNARNNINGLGALARQDVLTLDRSGGLLQVQEAVARKMVEVAGAFDNVYIEVCNEPYATRVPEDWQRHMATVVADAVAKLARPILISQNVANQTLRITDPHPAISVFSFHYATPPDAVATNYQLNKPIADSETGFRGTGDAPYRMEAWDFILAGGGIFNNLDYSFTAGREDGTFVIPPRQPGGGGPSLRRQLRILRDFITSFNFVRMRPQSDIIHGGVPAGGTARALVESGRAYAIYTRRVADRRAAIDPTSPRGADVPLEIDLPPGRWRAEWIDVLTGLVLKREAFTHAGGAARLLPPAWEDGVALGIRKR